MISQTAGFFKKCHITVFQLCNCIGSEDSREGIDHVRKIQEKQGEKGGGNGVSVQQIQIKLYGPWPGTFVVMLPAEPVQPMEQERKKKTYSPAKTTKAVKIKAAKKKAGITQLKTFRMEMCFIIL